MYEEYIQYNLIIKTIIVLSYEVFCYKPNNESYKISSVGNERLVGSGKETIIDRSVDTNRTIFKTIVRYLSNYIFKTARKFLVILMIVFLIHVMYLKI